MLVAALLDPRNKQFSFDREHFIMLAKEFSIEEAVKECEKNAGGQVNAHDDVGAFVYLFPRYGTLWRQRRPCTSPDK